MSVESDQPASKISAQPGAEPACGGESRAAPSWPGADARAAEGTVEIPLFSTPAYSPDAWHEVRAPGGYEYWHFDGEDAKNNVQFIAVFFEGLVFHPGYLRRYRRFRRRPTRTRPPLPGDFPAVYFAVYGDGRPLAHWLTLYPPDAYEASRDQPSVAIGPNRFTMGADGSYNLTLRGTPWENTRRGARRLEGYTLQASLSLKPSAIHEPLQLDFGGQSAARAAIAVSAPAAGEAQKHPLAQHHWIVSNPRCEVAGVIQIRRSSSAPPEAQKDQAPPGSSAKAGAARAAPGIEEREIAFWGRGYHDHQFGTTPLSVGVRRWIRGRVIFEDRCLSFQYLRSRQRGKSIEAHLVEESDAGIRLSPLQEVSAIDWLRTPWMLRYPGSMQFGDELRLQHPRVMFSYPYVALAEYEATCGGRSGKALVEITDPRRVSWPGLRGVVGKAIDKGKWGEGEG